MSELHGQIFQTSARFVAMSGVEGDGSSSRAVRFVGPIGTDFGNKQPQVNPKDPWQSGALTPVAGDIEFEFASGTSSGWM